MLRRLMDSRTTIEFVDGQNDVGTVRIDPAQLEQVIMNLALNARDPMPEGGVVRIVLERLRVTGARVVRVAQNSREGAPRGSARPQCNRSCNRSCTQQAVRPLLTSRAADETLTPGAHAPPPIR